MQSKEVSLNVAQQANEKWRLARDAGVNAERESVHALNLIREIGILLQPCWKEVQGQLEFGERSIQMCLTFARKHPEPVIDPTRAIRMLDEIRMTTGLLPFTDGHGPQQLHAPNFFSVFAKQVVSFRSDFKKQLARSPIEQWDYPTLEQWVTQAEPWVNEINDIHSRAKAQMQRAT